MRIGPRLIGAFAIVAAISLLVGGVGYYVLTTVQADFEDMLGTEVPAVQAAQGSQHDAEAGKAILFEYLQIEDAGERAASRTAWEGTISDFDVNIGTLLNTSDSQTRTNLIQEIDASHDVFQGHAAELMDGHDSALSDAIAGNAAMERADSAGAALANAMQDLVLVTEDKSASSDLTNEIDIAAREGFSSIEIFLRTTDSGELAGHRANATTQLGPSATGMTRVISDGLVALRALNPTASETALIDSAAASRALLYADAMAVMDDQESLLADQAVIDAATVDFDLAHDTFEAATDALSIDLDEMRVGDALVIGMSTHLEAGEVDLDRYLLSENVSELAGIRADVTTEFGPISIGTTRELQDPLAGLENLTLDAGEMAQVNAIEVRLDALAPQANQVMNTHDTLLNQAAQRDIATGDAGVAGKAGEVAAITLQGRFNASNANLTTAVALERGFMDARMLLGGALDSQDRTTLTTDEIAFQAQVGTTGPISLALTSLTENNTGNLTVDLATATAELALLSTAGSTAITAHGSYLDSVAAQLVERGVVEASTDALRIQLTNLESDLGLGIPFFDFLREIEAHTLLAVEDLLFYRGETDPALLNVYADGFITALGPATIGSTREVADRLASMTASTSSTAELAEIQIMQAQRANLYAEGLVVMAARDSELATEMATAASLASAEVQREALKVDLDVLSDQFAFGALALPIAKEVDGDVTEGAVLIEEAFSANDQTALSAISAGFTTVVGPTAFGQTRHIADDLATLASLTSDPAIRSIIQDAQNARADFYSDGQDSLTASGMVLADEAEIATDIIDLKQAVEDMDAILANLLTASEIELGAAQDRTASTVSLATIILFTIAIVGMLIGLIFGFIISQGIAKPLREVSDGTNKVAAGDLTVEIESDRDDETGELAGAVRTMVTNLNELVGSIQMTSEEVSSSSEELVSTAEEMNSLAEQVSAAVSQINTGSQAQLEKVNEVAGVIGDLQRESATMNEQSIATAGDTTTKMQSIRDQIYTNMKVTESLAARSDEIGEILNVITEITDQTNLLALNAAIEAARAGEHGRGFAVVADEVKNLATESKRSADRIAILIKETQNESQASKQAMVTSSEEVDKGLAAMEQTNKLINEMVTKQASALTTIASSIDQIATIAEESSSATEEVSSSTEELTASMEEMSSSAQELSNMAVDLQTSVETFKVKDTGTQRKGHQLAARPGPPGVGGGGAGGTLLHKAEAAPVLIPKAGKSTVKTPGTEW